MIPRRKLKLMFELGSSGLFLFDLFLLLLGESGFADVVELSVDVAGFLLFASLVFVKIESRAFWWDDGFTVIVLLVQD